MKKLPKPGYLLMLLLVVGLLAAGCAVGGEPLSEQDTAGAPPPVAATGEPDVAPAVDREEGTPVTERSAPNEVEADVEDPPGDERVAPAETEGEVAPTPAPTRRFAGKVPAPEFPPGLDWLNTDGPLALADLRGKIVLLDFWTYGCINCIHIIPDLERLEEKYADELVVIGVHSAKFENEGETENIRRIVQRYELEHPVVNDENFIIWRTYGARAWPTLVLIDPLGNVVGYHAGEGVYELFDPVLEQMVVEFEDEIDTTPVDLVLERESLANSPLLFPGKVVADAANNRLFIADSNHNRLVVTDLDGRVLEVIGSGREGLSDGDYESATFFRPQGLALADAATLYVADTENQVIRRVDLAAEQVETVAGTGEQVYSRDGGGPALETPLNSPWDVLYHDGLLYIAMAGQHQLWQYDPQAETVSVFAGSGREELVDGRLLEAGLNQPSGLATDGARLYVADSEASAIRAADLNRETGRMETIVGTGLFDFGDVDGVGDEVRLQHPLGVVYRDGLLYVADTYNSKIKVVDPESKEAVTFVGGPEAGWRDGEQPLFDEPGGISLGGHYLYVADTNNHVVRRVEVETGATTTIVLIDEKGLLTRQPGDMYTGDVVTLPPQTVGAGEGEIRLEVALPEGYKVNDLAPFSMTWRSSDGSVALGEADASRRIVAPEFPISIPVIFNEGVTTLTGELVIYYCDVEAQQLCSIEQVRLEVPLTVAPEGEPVATLSYAVEQPPVE
ncbi:MAG: thioredoxin-like domain-containing protein [Candidatus Promineifilaceae bacterium]|nr:thioredoxin-like domain-containing protein [Candidatus Promineifilaceae bacterium]